MWMEHGPKLRKSQDCSRFCRFAVLQLALAQWPEVARNREVESPMTTLKAAYRIALFLASIGDPRGLAGVTSRGREPAAYRGWTNIMTS